MKSTFIFLSVFVLALFSLSAIPSQIEKPDIGNPQNFIKFHFTQPQCWGNNWYGKVKSGSTTWSCGPTTNCVCGVEGLGQGWYEVWGESPLNCIRTEVQNIWHNGYGFTDVYTVNYYLCGDKH